MHPSRIAAIIILALTAIGAVASPDPDVLAIGGLVLAAGLLLLWTSDSVPILLLPFLLQWLPIGLKPIESAVTGAPLNDLTKLGGDLRSSAIFSFIGLLLFTIGMRVAMLAMQPGQLKRLGWDAEQWSAYGVTTFSLTLLGIGHVLTAGFGRFGSFNEIASTLSTIAYCGLFMLLYWSLKMRKNQKLAITIVLFELVFGMTGFFGEFRTTLFVLTLALICAQTKISAQWVITALLLGTVSLVTMVFWTAIKPDYRAFLNEGQHFQGTNRPISERLQYLSDSARDFDSAQFADGFDRLVDRASYIDFLSAVREYVPSNTPFENGARTLASINHVFTPRIFNPDKPPLESDTDVTSRYTGIPFNNYTYVSVSIGYFGELYIDYGEVGAWVALAILGLLLGLICRAVLSYSGTPMMLNVALALIVTLPFWYFEQALVKVIGSMVMSFLIVMSLQRIVFGMVLSNLLKELRRPRLTGVAAPRAEA